MADNPDDESVGYGRPPKKYRWQKGRSGNSKGRPKKAKGTRSTLRDLLLAEVTGTEGGKTVTLTKIEILILAQISKAAKGDTRAFKAIMDLAEQHGLMHEIGDAVKSVGGDDAAIMANVLKRMQRG
jgi:hypothetical protein